MCVFYLQFFLLQCFEQATQFGEINHNNNITKGFIEDSEVICQKHEAETIELKEKMNLAKKHYDDGKKLQNLQVQVIEAKKNYYWSIVKDRETIIEKLKQKIDELLVSQGQLQAAEAKVAVSCFFKNKAKNCLTTL